MNQELQTLLDKVDKHFLVDINQRPSDKSIHGAIKNLPASIKIDTKLGGAFSSHKPQVLFAVIIGENCVTRWGCINDEDTEQLLRWWFEKLGQARDDHYDAQKFPQEMWNNL
jgi:hypothetical protein